MTTYSSPLSRPCVAGQHRACADPTCQCPHHDASHDTVSWWVTHGLGTPWGRTYTEVRVPADLTREEQDDAVRRAAFATYGQRWAFSYPPEEYEDAIGRWGLTLREVIIAADQRTPASMVESSDHTHTVITLPVVLRSGDSIEFTTTRTINLED